MHIFKYTCYDGDHNRNSHETPCTLLSRPRYFSSKQCRGWLHGQRPVCWCCALRLLNQPYLTLYINTQTTHNTYTQSARKGETAWNLWRSSIPRVNDSFCIHGQSQDLLHTLASIFLMHIRILYHIHISALINYNRR